MSSHERPFAIVTGASTGIGYELARCCADNGFDLLIAADEPTIRDAARTLSRAGGQVHALEVDLATDGGVDRLYEAAHGRPIDALLANAGRGLGHAFLDQDFEAVRHVIDTNITGTVRLIHRAGRDMRAQRRGRILITGSIAGFMPGTYSAVYNGTKAFIDSFALALRAELKDTGVTVTCLMPGATETEFFERAGMLDTKVGQAKKDDPSDVARIGFEAMMQGEADVVSGWKNKLQSAVANVTPASMLAEQHRKKAAPGSAYEDRNPSGTDRPERSRHMNAVQFLLNEHQKAKAEFAKVLKASPDQRGDLWEALEPELEMHEQIENTCVYEPLSRDARGSDETLARWQQEHLREVQRVESLLTEIDGLDAEDSAWLNKVKEVHRSLETHIEEEETTIFPRISRVWDTARLERAGQELEEMKSRKAGAAAQR